MAVRVMYLSQFLDVHDQRFLAAFDDREDVEVVVLSIIPSLPPSFPAFRRVRIETLYDPRFPHDDPFRPEYSPLARIRIRLGQRYYAQKIQKRLKEGGFHILHTGWVQSDGRVGMLTGFHPTLLMPWGSDILVNPDRDTKTWKDTRQILERADFITCDCETVREKIRAIAPRVSQEKFFIMPWGVDVDRFAPVARAKEAESPLLVMTRSFHQVYNIPFFLEIVCRLRAEIPGLRVVLAGEGPERPTIEDYIRKLNLDSCVTLLGIVPNLQLAELLQSASLYVSTSLSDGSSVSLLEAMACGLPCAVSDLPSNREWVRTGENGILLDPRNLASSVRMMEQLLRCPDLLAKYGQRSREIILRRADWKANVGRLIDLYGQLTKKVFT